MSPELTVGGEGEYQTRLVASAPELSIGGKRARRTGLVASAPELSVEGERACRTGLVALAPELSVGGEERVGRGWLRRPRNYPSVDRVGCVCGASATPCRSTPSSGDRKRVLTGEVFCGERPRSPSVKIFHFLDPDQKSVSVPEPSHFPPPYTDHSKGARTASLSPQGERVAADGNYIPPRRS